MINYQTIKIDDSFCIRVLPESRGFELSDVEKEGIESIWNQELRERSGHLVNGKLLNLVQCDRTPWVGEFIEYKFYLAQLRNPYYKEALNICPLGISGITSAGDKILIGQRSPEVMLYQELYECVPSGGIEPSALKEGCINLKNQFEIELFEETGISTTEIKRVECFAIVYDPEHHHYQLCGEIFVNYSILREPLTPTWEYLSLKWLSKNELKSFVFNHGQEMVPMTEHLLTLRKYIKK